MDADAAAAANLTPSTAAARDSMHGTATATAAAAVDAVEALQRSSTCAAGHMHLTCGRGDCTSVATAVPALVRDLCGQYRLSLPQLVWTRACWTFVDFLRSGDPLGVCAPRGAASLGVQGASQRFPDGASQSAVACRGSGCQAHGGAGETRGSGDDAHGSGSEPHDRCCMLAQSCPRCGVLAALLGALRACLAETAEVRLLPPDFYL